MSVSAEALGRAIKTLRTALDIDRKTLAERAGISYPYLSQIENGQRDPSTKKLTKLAEELGVQLHELYEVAEGAPPPAGAGAASAVGRVRTSDIAKTIFDKVTRAAHDRRSDEAGGEVPESVVDQLQRLVDLGQDLTAEDLEILIGLAERLHSQRGSSAS